VGVRAAAPERKQSGSCGRNRGVVIFGHVGWGGSRGKRTGHQFKHGTLIKRKSNFSHIEGNSEWSSCKVKSEEEFPNM
jgi:hypothetical protein